VEGYLDHPAKDKSDRLAGRGHVLFRKARYGVERPWWRGTWERQCVLSVPDHSR